MNRVGRGSETGDGAGHIMIRSVTGIYLDYIYAEYEDGVPAVFFLGLECRGKGLIKRLSKALTLLFSSRADFYPSCRFDPADVEAVLDAFSFLGPDIALDRKNGTDPDTGEKVSVCRLRNRFAARLCGVGGRIDAFFEMLATGRVKRGGSIVLEPSGKPGLPSVVAEIEVVL